MFKEIAEELMSILSDDPIQKIAHMPNKELAKTLELLFDIKFEDIERIYNTKFDNYIIHTVLYRGNDKIESNKCFAHGLVRNIICIPISVLDKNENNAITICKAINVYTSLRVSSILTKYDQMIGANSIANETCELAIPVITTYIMKKLYGGAALPTIIYNSLVDTIPAYAKKISVTGIESIMNLLDEDLSIELLLDNSFICAIKKDANKYPGIWSKV